MEIFYNNFYFKDVSLTKSILDYLSKEAYIRIEQRQTLANTFYIDIINLNSKTSEG